MSKSWFALAWLVLAHPLVAAEKSPPNILFIFADDWGWGDLSCHGNAEYKTPHLDKLALQGTDFQRFTVASGVCSPSRTAIVTGQYPARFSIHEHFAAVPMNAQRDMPDWLTPKTVTLPRLLKEAGYATAHFGKWHLTNTGCPDAPLPSAYGYDESGVFNGPGPQVSADPRQKPADTDLAIDFIRRHAAQPFFINLWVHATHTPHYPIEHWRKQFAHLGARKAVYAAVIADADQRIGQVLAVLDELKLADNTLVVFSSDNGPERTGRAKTQGEGTKASGLGTFYSVGTTAGLRGRKRSLYQGGVNVPFLVRWPGVTPVGKIDKTSMITAVDILPTFCAAADVKLPQDYAPDGQNMLPALQGSVSTREKPIFWEWRGSGGGDAWPRRGACDERWSLLTDVKGDRVELYDLTHDRAQAADVATEHPGVVKQLRTQLIAWKQTLPTSPARDCLSKTRKAAGAKKKRN